MKNNYISDGDRYIRKRRFQKRWQKVTMVLASVVVFCTTYALILPAITMEKGCQLPEHTHSDACYTQVVSKIQKTPSCILELHEHEDSCRDAEGNILCGYADFVVHQHDSACYDESGELWCALPEIKEHQHGDSCYNAPEPHTHTDDCYETESELTCQEEEHTHSDSCYQRLICDNEDAEHIHQATCYEYSTSLLCGQTEHTHEDGCYIEKKLLICGRDEVPDDAPPVLTCEEEEIFLHQHTEECFDEDHEDEQGSEDKNLICGKTQILEHQHGDACFTTEEIPVDTEALTCTIPEGDGAHTHSENCYDANSELICEIEESSGHQHSDRCYGTWELTCGMTEHIHNEECTPKPAETQEFKYQDAAGRYNLALSVTGDLPEGAQLCVETQDDISMLSSGDNDPFADSLDVTALNVYFLNGEGSLVDTSNCEMTAKLTWVTGSDVMPLNMEEEDDERFGELLVWHVDDEAVLTPMASSIYSLNDPAVTLDTPVRSGTMVLQTVDASKINYTAQYYGYTLQGHVYDENSPQYGDAAGLPVINTANGGAGTSGTLPTNEQSPTTFEMPLKNVGTSDSAVYMLNSAETLTRLYKDETQTYAEAPNVFYLNKLAESTGYTLDEVWILKSGGNADSINRDDWDVYDATNVHFTSRPEFASGKTDVLCIQDGTVVRMTYKATSDYFDSTATFYDYDITGQNTSTEWYNTDRQGINAEGNYVGSGAKLAFGNLNTGTGRDTEKLGNYYINKGNRDPAVYKLCSFGLVRGLDGNGHLIYADGVVAPKLFNEGGANGKYTYENSGLTFKRYGDNYTLYSVSVPGAGSATDLNQFTHPGTYEYIFTNNFWPMDKATKKEDPLFGGSEKVYFNSDKTKAFPASDDGIAHNSYFGMQYSVSFELTADYIGPLNYLFYGDDDMWVFLTYPDRTSKLICDIGGVHSSVGEYVDLWDYLDKDNDEGTYTLTVFYTERGASGSTCYISFTLPSVFGVNIRQETSDLTVKKNVVGAADLGKEFEFSIRFYDASGNEIKDDYLYTRYTASGAVINSDLVICDGATFKLKNGEYINISGLPYGLRYTIQETSHDGCTVSNSVNGVVSSGDTAQGTIMLDVKETVEFTNTVNTVNGLTLQKLDPVGKSLTGAEFTLTPDGSSTAVEFIEGDGGVYTVPNSVTNMIQPDTAYYIALSGNLDWVIGKDDNNNAVLRQKNADTAVKVKLQKQDDGSYVICSASDNSYRLNVRGGNYSQGDAIMFYSNTGATPAENEKWLLVVNTDGSLTIKPRNAVVNGSDMCLDLNSAKVEDGTKIQLWESNNSTAQKWKLVPVNPDTTQTTTTLTVNESGRLTVQNLAPGTYTLKETKAPLYCVGLSQPVTFTVATNGTVTVTGDSGGKVSVDGNNRMQINVRNDYEDRKLTLKKLVENIETDQEFKFKVSWSLDAGKTEYESKPVTLKHNETDTVDIPYGATVTIEEPNHNGFALRFENGGTVMNSTDGKLIFTITENITITAINSGSYELPSTGGTGTLSYTAGGVLLMAAALYLLYIQKKRRKGEQTYS